MESKKTGAVVAGVIAAVVIVGAVIWWMNNDSSDESSTNQQETVQNEQPSNENQQEEASQDIVALAVATPDLSTLVAAVQAAGLVETLQGEGPFTVLAPTNAAFGELPEGTLETLLEEENKDQLTGILTYHVIAGDIKSTDLTDGQVVKTVNGEELTVELADGKAYFVDAKGGKAMVVTADVEASNGTVHVIDAVLLPN